jgi:glycosyltransferase involved in cell wall biosynthesis
MSMQLLADRPGSAAQNQRRLLLVSYVFPPDPTVGARRWAKLAHFATARGWGLDVITRKPDQITPQGQRVLDELPAGVRVFAVPAAPLPFARAEHAALQLYRRLRRPRASATVGSANPAAPAAASLRPETVARSDVRWSLRSPRSILRAFWVWRDVTHLERWSRNAFVEGREIAQPGVHKAVITSGPPHWTHLAGRRLAASIGVPFVMDMRDPWSLFEHLLERLASPLAHYYTGTRERRNVEAAALVVANTEQARRAMSAKYPHVAPRIIAITNGVDDDPIPRPRPTSKFIIAYAGTVYVFSDLRHVMRAARRVITELSLTPDQFGIELVGHFDGPSGVPASQMAGEEQVSDFVSVDGYRPPAEVAERLARASLLVTLPGTNPFTTIPAKVFECMRFNAWLLALSDRGSATDTLLEGTTADVVPASDVDGIAAAIQRRVVAFQRDGTRPSPIAADERFTRAAQARILFDAIDRVAEGAA